MTIPRPTVLLVDDEPHSLSAMRMALEDEFDCITASDAETAAAKMEEEWVQVVICDQRMPGRTGIELLTDLHERWPSASSPATPTQPRWRRRSATRASTSS